MGSYNPHSPYIIGNEWVPIRQASYQPDDITERGYTFSIDHAVVPVSGVFSIDKLFGAVAGTAMFASVYADGDQDLTGPVRSVLIPASAVTISGGAVYPGSDVANPTVPGFGGGIIGFDGDTFLINFDTGAYAQQLFGKRILGMEFEYVLYQVLQSLPLTTISLSRGYPVTSTYGIQTGAEGLPIAFGVYHTKTSIARMNFLNPFWSSTSTALTSPIYPWRYQELSLFSASTPAASRLHIGIQMGTGDFPTLDILAFNYAALRVIYCEEKRIKYGGQRTYAQIPSNYSAGPNYILLRGPDFTLTGSLSPGRYVVTASHERVSNSPVLKVPPFVNALRQLYELPSHHGVTVNRTLTNNAEFTSSTTDVLPHLTLHHAGGIVTGSHAYGTQISAPVYGTTTVTQEIEDDPAGTSKPYPQVRFYARRFGNTAIPLKLFDAATSTQTVSITPADFDALPEIVDGWREVTLRFANPPSFATAGGNVSWRFSADNETAANQWQILGADGPSPASPQATALATYYAPNITNLSWQTPAISGIAVDTISDATLIFSVDPPTVTGLAISTNTQPVTGITLDCGVPAACIPTGISFSQLAWPSPGGGLCDRFTRVTASGWGTAESGQAWTTTGGTGANYAVNGTEGQHLQTAAVTNLRTTAGSFTDVEVRGLITLPAVATGASYSASLMARYADVNNHYMGQLIAGIDGGVTLRLTTFVAGVATDLFTSPGIGGYEAGDKWWLVFSVIGSTLAVKAWPETGAEPANWTLTATNTALTAAGAIGLRTILGGGSTSAPITITIDNVSATPGSYAKGTIEVQRRDTVDSTWQTIMLSPATACVTGFSDFEARAGVTSDYRVRTCNVLDFCGPWASGSGTLPAPGVTGAGTGNSVLMFTSNKQPSSNLAYQMQFEGQPVEQFAFPEADTVTLQRMFGKDFFTAFRPLERGGDRFDRVILVSAAAIPAQSLAGFRGLRDLAWADLPYVCVRDELGNRWYATVLVPSGEVRRNRTLHLAQIQVIEITDTPCAVAT